MQSQLLDPVFSMASMIELLSIKDRTKEGFRHVMLESKHLGSNRKYQTFEA